MAKIADFVESLEKHGLAYDLRISTGTQCQRSRANTQIGEVIMSKERNIQGEGDYESARRYQEEAEQFVKSGKMKRKTASISQSDEAELEVAEKAGADRDSTASK
ncbi:MAG: hypothetical protein ACREYC_07035 [Gammaproteobacteria bacterium]